MINTELSWEAVKSKDRQSEPKATIYSLSYIRFIKIEISDVGNNSQGQSIEDDTLSDE